MKFKAKKTAEYQCQYFLEKINKIDKPLSRFAKEETQIANINTEMEVVCIDSAAIKELKGEYHGQLSS